MVNVSIVTFHTPVSELRVALSSLLACQQVSRVDIIDNASETAIRDVARESGNRVSYRTNPNIGFGSSHNIALRQSLAEGAIYHLVLNADVSFTPGTLEKCLHYMDAHPEVGQLIPRTVFPSGEYQPVWHPLPTPFEMVMHRFTPLGWWRKRREHYEMTDFDLSKPADIPVHHGCFMLLRCDALRKVGIFDQRYFMYAEDFDLTRRIHRHYRTVYFPEATIVHLFQRESRVNPKLFWIHCVSMLKYFAKWGFIFDPERREFNQRLLREVPMKKH